MVALAELPMGCAGSGPGCHQPLRTFTVSSVLGPLCTTHHLVDRVPLVIVAWCYPCPLVGLAPSLQLVSEGPSGTGPRPPLLPPWGQGLPLSQQQQVRTAGAKKFNLS